MEQYRGYSYDDMVGKNIREFFPYTKMMESLDMKEDERIILYQGEGIASQVLCEASFHKLIKDDNQVLGLMTYDLFQNIPELERFLGMYINLDEKVKYAKHDLKKYHTTKYSIDDFIGSNPEIIKLKQDIRRAALNNSTVLITGETGTGKEIVAHSIHNLLKRGVNSFVKLNVSS